MTFTVGTDFSIAPGFTLGLDLALDPGIDGQVTAYVTPSSAMVLHRMLVGSSAVTLNPGSTHGLRRQLVGSSSAFVEPLAVLSELYLHAHFVGTVPVAVNNAAGMRFRGSMNGDLAVVTTVGAYFHFSDVVPDFWRSLIFTRSY